MTEPRQGGPDVLGVRLPVLLAPPRVYDEVGGVLTPVQDEADQVGLAVDVGHQKVRLRGLAPARRAF